MKIRALIVEDELLALDRLRDCLVPEEGIEIVGEARDGQSAVERIDALSPDLLFLDVQLPLLSGFDVLRAAKRKPAVIFTTAHDQYAVHAFEWGAFDYLVKPFERERVRLALERYAQRSRLAEIEPLIEERLSTGSAGVPLQRFFVKHRGVVVPVEVGEIVSILAEDDYSAVHVSGTLSGQVRGKVHLVHLPLREFARRLDARVFRRVHRSAIVNVGCILSMEAAGRGALLRMSDGSVITVSRSGAQSLRDLRLG